MSPGDRFVIFYRAGRYRVAADRGFWQRQDGSYRDDSQRLPSPCRWRYHGIFRYSTGYDNSD